jgi:hypothetical protein
VEIIKSGDLEQVEITNNNGGAQWYIGLQAKAPKPPLPDHYNVRVTAAINPPPPGFLSNSRDRFVVRGTFIMSGQRFVSGPMTYDAADSDPQVDLYTFTI